MYGDFYLKNALFLLILCEISDIIVYRISHIMGDVLIHIKRRKNL